MSGTWRRSLGKAQWRIPGSRLDTHETSMRPSGMYAVIAPPKSIASEKDIGAAMESKVLEVVGGKWWRVYPKYELRHLSTRKVKRLPTRQCATDGSRCLGRISQWRLLRRKHPRVVLCVRWASLRYTPHLPVHESGPG